MKRYISKKLAIIIAGVMLIAGLAGVLPELYFSRSNAGTIGAHNFPIASAQTADPATPLITGHSEAISIPTVDINISVIDGYYNQHTRDWTLSLDKAQFATSTAQPNNKQGNTFIYGHARKGVFYTLPNIKPGDKAFITTDNGYKFTYRFYSTYATNPTDLSVLTYSGPAMLTLQTCSGTWYQNRQMYLFSYEGYEKIKT